MSYDYLGARNLDGLVSFVKDEKYLELPETAKKAIPMPPEGLELMILKVKYYGRKLDFAINKFLNDNGIQDGTPKRYAVYVAMGVIPITFILIGLWCCCAGGEPEITDDTDAGKGDKKVGEGKRVREKID